MDIGLLSGLELFAADEQKGAPFFMLLMPLVLIFFLYQWLIVRPQKRDRQNVLTAIKKNERVLTIGGIYGVVTNVHEEKNEVTIRVDEATGAKICVTLNSIARVLSDETSGEKSSSK